MELRNPGPLAARFGLRLGIEAEELLGVTVAGTWRIQADGRLQLADEQAPPSVADAYRGEAGMSSLLHAAEAGGPRPGTDVGLVGEARPGGPARRHRVALRCGPVQRELLVSGERRAERGLLGWRVSEPEVFEACPLTWELAAGGTDPGASPDDMSIDRRNPVGRGHRAKRSGIERAGQAMPRITGPDERLDEPVGVGFIPGHWLPRAGFAGTCDERWRTERCPLLPGDFDARFFQSAAPGLSSASHLVGGEDLAVEGCGAPLRCVLPRLSVGARLDLGKGDEAVACPLVQVAIDADQRLLRLAWHGEGLVHGRFPRLRSVSISVEGLA